MNNFQPNAIINFQNFVNLTNIKRLIKKFIKKNVNEEEQPLNIDYSKGIVSYYCSINDKVLETKFETELKELLWQLTNDIKSEIELSNTKLKTKEKYKYWNNILSSFNYIENDNFEVISTFPICLKPSEEIKDYLNKKYHFPFVTDNNSASYFSLKPKYSRRDLEKIYYFMDDNLFIDADEYSFEDFYSVLNYIEIKDTFRFNTSTENLVCLLNEMSNLFADLTRKKIEESERFKTKSGTILSVSNYESTINRIKNKNNSDLDKIRAFFSENFPK
tara:strand:- start:7607 stop:8431 length:825 start_codon:yes stop_codon:yes gene_type:complete